MKKIKNLLVVLLVVPIGYYGFRVIENRHINTMICSVMTDIVDADWRIQGVRHSPHLTKGFKSSFIANEKMYNSHLQFIKNETGAFIRCADAYNIVLRSIFMESHAQVHMVVARRSLSVSFSLKGKLRWKIDAITFHAASSDGVPILFMPS